MSSIVTGETLIIDIPPGCDLLEEIESFLEKRHIRLAAVLSGMGTVENVQLIPTNSSRARPQKFAGSFELLNASGIVRRENNGTIAKIGVIISGDGKLFAGKLSSGCLTAKPDGVTLFLSIVGRALGSSRNKP